MKAYYNNLILVEDVKIANTFTKRLVGLLGKNKIEDNEALLLSNCSSIHCLFMKFTIDAVYLSKDMEVLYKETIKPWKIGKIVKKTSHILELHEGLAHNIKEGDILKFID